MTQQQTQADRAEQFLNQKDLSSRSWVSPTHKYVYVGLGKTGSTRIKLTLHLLEGYPVLERPFPWLHARETPDVAFVPGLDDFDAEEGSAILTSPEWFRFCFVRNPYDRLFSAYKAFIMRDSDPPSAFYREIARQIRSRHRYDQRSGCRDAVVCFRDFVWHVEETLHVRQDYHWCQMIWGLRPDLVDYDFVGRFETFNADFRSVLQRLGVDADAIPELLRPENSDALEKLPLAAVYDWELAETVYEMYREDFRTYGYAKDSWQMPAPDRA